MWRGRVGHLSPDVGGWGSVGEGVEGMLRHPSQLLLPGAVEEATVVGLASQRRAVGRKDLVRFSGVSACL